MLVFTIYSSMGRSLNSKFVALALIIFSTSAFPFRDDSASKNLTLSKISSRDQTPSNDPTDDQFLGSADPVGSSLGLTADNSNQQQLIPLDGLDSQRIWKLLAQALIRLIQAPPQLEPQIWPADHGVAAGPDR